MTAIFEFQFSFENLFHTAVLYVRNVLLVLKLKISKFVATATPTEPTESAVHSTYIYVHIYIKRERDRGSFCAKYIDQTYIYSMRKQITLTFAS